MISTNLFSYAHTLTNQAVRLERKKEAEPQSQEDSHKRGKSKRFFFAFKVLSSLQLQMGEKNPFCRIMMHAKKVGERESLTKYLLIALPESALNTGLNACQGLHLGICILIKLFELYFHD